MSDPLPSSAAQEIFLKIPKSRLWDGFMQIPIEDFTCAYCRDMAECRSAFDLYNQDGDCLESK